MNTLPGNIDDIVDRHIDQALRREADAGPPADFARRVAVRAERGRAADAPIERWLLRALATVFALSALVVVALYGREWLVGFTLLLPAAAGATTLNWIAALMACVGLSWSFERLRTAPRRNH
jgi:hypothetical protein